MIYWISVNERLPKSGQEVLSYYLDTFYGKDNPIDQIDIVTYFEKGIIYDWKQTKIKEDGFYLFDNAGSPTGECGYRKHADIITHWMPLPEPPNKYVCPKCKNIEHSLNANYCKICGLKIEREADAL